MTHEPCDLITRASSRPVPLFLMSRVFPGGVGDLPHLASGLDALPDAEEADDPNEQ